MLALRPQPSHMLGSCSKATDWISTRLMISDLVSRCVQQQQGGRGVLNGWVEVLAVAEGRLRVSCPPRFPHHVSLRARGRERLLWLGKSELDTAGAMDHGPRAGWLVSVSVLSESPRTRILNSAPVLCVPTTLRTTQPFLLETTAMASSTGSEGGSALRGFFSRVLGAPTPAGGGAAGGGASSVAAPGVSVPAPIKTAPISREDSLPGMRGDTHPGHLPAPPVGGAPPGRRRWHGAAC